MTESISSSAEDRKHDPDTAAPPTGRPSRRNVLIALAATAGVAVAAPIAYFGLREPESLTHPDFVESLALSPDGKTLATGSADKKVHLSPL